MILQSSHGKHIFVGLSVVLPVSILLAVTKAGSHKVALKSRRRRRKQQQQQQQGAVSLAAAEEINTDAVTAVVLSELGDIFAFKKNWKEWHCRLLSVENMVLLSSKMASARV